MDFGIVTAKVDEIGYVTHAENLGYTHKKHRPGASRLIVAMPLTVAGARRSPGTLSLGTGHTGMRMLGHKPMKLAPFREYAQVVRALLTQGEADYTLAGETHRIRFQMREHRFIDLDHRLQLPRRRGSALHHPRPHQDHLPHRSAREEIAQQILALEEQGLRQIMLYPPLNRQHRVIEDFADNVMARL